MHIALIHPGQKMEIIRRHRSTSKSDEQPYQTSRPIDSLNTGATFAANGIISKEFVRLLKYLKLNKIQNSLTIYTKLLES